VYVLFVLKAMSVANSDNIISLFTCWHKHGCLLLSPGRWSSAGKGNLTYI